MQKHLVSGHFSSIPAAALVTQTMGLVTEDGIKEEEVVQEEKEEKKE